jgi:hypothetical protein
LNTKKLATDGKAGNNVYVTWAIATRLERGKYLREQLLIMERRGTNNYN